MKYHDGVPFDVSHFVPAEANEAELRQYFDLTKEIIAEVSPTLPAPQYDAYVEELRNPLSYRGPRECWVARHDGWIGGTAEITFFEHENGRYAHAVVRVTRKLRRNGIGSAMLSACLDTVNARGRDILVGNNVQDDTPGMKWATALGFVVTRRSLWQTLHVGEVDPGLWSTPIPRAFRLKRWIDRTPNEFVERFARARTAIADAPADQSGLRHPAWTVARVREREAELSALGEERRFIVAVHEPTGDVAGLTEVALDPSLPNTCFQEDTAVLSQYRGLGLGRTMKGAMMQWLTADRPAIAEVRTSTAADNVHMIRVNRQLGYVTTAVLNTVEVATGELATMRR